jgi:hypothetical protein
MLLAVKLKDDEVDVAEELKSAFKYKAFVLSLFVS